MFSDLRDYRAQIGKFSESRRSESTYWKFHQLQIKETKSKV